MERNTKHTKFSDMYNSLDNRRKKDIELQEQRFRLASQIYKIRKMQDLTSTELAEKSGVSYKTISKIENNKPVNFDSVVKVLHSLNLAINYSLV